MRKSDVFPAGTKVALNDCKARENGGPSPPKGSHRYLFKLYALDGVIGYPIWDKVPKKKTCCILHTMEEYTLGRQNSCERTSRKSRRSTDMA